MESGCCTVLLVRAAHDDLERICANPSVLARGYVCHRLTFRCRLGWDEGGAAMRRENYVAKQQRIGERLTRAMARAHMDRRELAELTGYSEAQIVGWSARRSTRPS
jgi:hypothetical protein